MDRHGIRNGVNGVRGMGAGYDPYTYQPMLRSFFQGGRFPQEITRAQEENPQAARHIGAIYQFGQWFQGAMPDAFNALMRRNPSLLDPLAIVAAGALVPVAPASSSGNSLAGMSGLGEVIYDLNGQPYDTETGAVPSGSDFQKTVTEWGKSLLDFGKSYITYDAQKQLLQANIKRAEQGLPPLDMSGYGLGLNFGIAPETQKLVLFGIITLGAIGLMAGARRRR